MRPKRRGLGEISRQTKRQTKGHRDFVEMRNRREARRSTVHSSVFGQVSKDGCHHACSILGFLQQPRGHCKARSLRAFHKGCIQACRPARSAVPGEERSNEHLMLESWIVRSLANESLTLRYQSLFVFLHRSLARPPLAASARVSESRAVIILLQARSGCAASFEACAHTVMPFSNCN